MSRRFNGTSDYLEHGAPVVSALPITMACWFYVSARLPGTHALIAIGDAADSNTVKLTASATDVTVRSIAVGGSPASSVTALPDPRVATWQHACGVFAASNSRVVYINGGARAFGSVTVELGTPTVTTLGATYSAGSRTQFLEGYLAEAAVWDVALSEADVKLLAAGYYPDQIRPGNIVSYWSLAGQYSPDEIDRTGRFDLTVTGATPAIANHPPMLPRTRRHRALELALVGAGPTFVPGDQPPARIIFQHA